MTRHDKHLHPYYRNPTSHTEHGGLLWYAAQVIKHRLSTKSLLAHGILSIEPNNQFKEGHIELAAILDESLSKVFLGEEIKNILKEYGLRYVCFFVERAVMSMNAAF